MKTKGRTLAVIGGTCALALAASWITVAAQSGYGPRPPYQTNAPRLSGTYQVDRARSDDPQAVATEATRRLYPEERDRVRQTLMSRLEPPEMLAIEHYGRSVSIASSRAPRMTLDADGRPHQEPSRSGRMMTTKADLLGERLIVSTQGNSGYDYAVTFEPDYNILRVTRRLDSPDLRTPVFVRSVYRRTTDRPQWDIYMEPAGYSREPRGYGRELYIPDGTRLIATLDQTLDTRTSREGDRFTLTTRGPGEYRDAVITGVLARVIGRSGGANMMFDFEGIRLLNGQSADIDGQLESVRTPNGAWVPVERTGALREGNRSDATVQNGAVGAALGAVIGAIAGGGKGAAIGAVVGGAGMVLLEGPDRLFLPAGTEFRLVVVGPAPPR